MTIDENKYDKFFIEKFKVKEVELRSEFTRVVAEHGYSEEIKLKFYLEAFQSLIAQFKREVTKDENFDYIISTLYQLFINLLNSDNIDADKIEKELLAFRTIELKNIVISYTTQEGQTQPTYKQYNLNSKYGRRKAREQAIRNYENGTPKYKNDIDNIKIVFWVIIGAVALIIYLVKANIK